MSRTRKAPAKATLLGNIDSVDSDWTVSGWCWSPDEPERRRIVCLAVDGLDVAETAAANPRADLLAAGYGDGGHGFAIRLSAGDIPAQEQSVLTLRDVATGQMVGCELQVTWPRRAEPAPAMVGNVEGASDDGWVLGWAWDPTNPDRRLTLDFVIDDVTIGSARATDFRPDLEAAGVGDGQYGFAFPLPWSVMSGKGEMRLAVRATETGENLCEPFTLRIGRLVGVEERINGLERQVRLLQARLVAREDAADAHREETAARDLFRTVAAFFNDLAETPDPAHRAGTLLRHAVGSVLDSHAALTLAIPDWPMATLLLLGDGPFGVIHACLAALQESGIDRIADIVLLDDLTQGADLALLPALVRNLRYARGGRGMSATARNDLAAEARADVVVVMSAHLRPAADALPLLLRTLADVPGAVLAGGCVLREDGRIEHVGLRMAGQGEWSEIAAGEDPNAPDTLAVRRVDAVADLFYAVRRTVLTEAGGFPSGYDDPGQAVAGLCLTLRALGHGVVMQPRARAQLAPSGVRDRGGSAQDRRRLRNRWHTVTQSLGGDGPTRGG